MSLSRSLFQLVLGRRLPTTTGDIRVRGPSAPITIRRDAWGIPHIEAQSDFDAWFGLGFCQGQDRAGQLEIFWRLGRGQLAEWVGPNGLPADRMSRRIGFRRAAEAQLPALSVGVTAIMEAFTSGLNAGHSVGLPKKPHEFAILGGQPSPWDGADVLAYLKLQSFLLPSNWDVELARLRLLRADGPEAVLALDPLYPAGHPITTDPTSSLPPNSRSDQSLLDLLAADLAAIAQFIPRGGGSNNWAIPGNRTASGKPLLASDPHLAPIAPPQWYLAHIRTPEWSAAGAGLAGTPGFAIGHNGFAAWGVTAGLTDNTDLFLETLGPDGASVREADGTFTPCEHAREVIRVKGRPDVVEEVLLTPRGPVITELFTNLPPPKGDGAEAVSIRAVWLDPLPVFGFLGTMRARSFEAFRATFADWPILPLNVVYADSAGAIGWQLAGQLPQRTHGHGLLPLPADAPGVGWGPERVPFDQMPHFLAREGDAITTANNAPTPIPGAPYLGLDFIDGYRCSLIRDELAKQTEWDVAACVGLQQNVRSLPWEEIRAVVLSLTPDDPAARDALRLLREWDGQVTADSAGAAVFELFVAEMCVRVAKAKAPTAWPAALGEVGLGAAGHNLFADRRVAHLVRLLHDQPGGWFGRGWADEMADVLGGIVQRLRREIGPGPAYWGWGHLRGLRLDHPLFGRHRLLGPVFNLGPVPCAGDQNTISQAGARPLHPTDFTHNMANMRAVFDLADLSKSVFVLCGGQSGNPFSPHYADQFSLWQDGEAVVMPWTQDQVIRGSKAVLRLVPGESV